MNKYNEHKDRNFTKGILIGFAITALILGACVYFCCSYIHSALLSANINSSVNIAKLIVNNFTITDSEVTYLKTLTFNEMEQDTVNKRLAKVATGSEFNDPFISVYVAIPLSEDEVIYYTDSSTSDFYGVEPGTPLDTMWLLNMAVDENGNAYFASRENIYRYSSTTSDLSYGYNTKKAFGARTSDEWGEVISGYAPLYTTSGNFVGLLGVDMDVAKYQGHIIRLTAVIVGILGIAILILFLLFFIYYKKYSAIKYAELYYNFYSDLSHDMRTPMNGILGMVHLAENETDPQELKHLISNIRSSSDTLLELINSSLNRLEDSNGTNSNDTTSSANLSFATSQTVSADYSVLANTHILLCEDHPLNAEITQKLLEKAGSIVDVAPDGTIGVTKFKDSPLNYYNAIIMDIRMPHMDGLTATRTIRHLERPDALTVPIIALSANAYQRDKQESIDAGMNAHLAKPVEVSILYRTLAAFIHKD